jgi:GT2 family glycosyltransferase
MKSRQKKSAQPAGGRLVAVILNYNSYEDSCRCVDALMDLGIVPAEDIVLVDNCSPDGSGPRLQQRFPRVKVVLSPDNGGFGAGINFGMRQAGDCEYLLILNPDTFFLENNFQLALDEFRSTPDLGVLGLNLINPDGSSQMSARRFYSILTVAIRRSPLGRLKIFGRLHDEHLMRGAWKQDAFEADWVLGAGFVVRTEAMREVGGMDEGYFLYVEDLDLCKRMWLAGWRVKAIPSVRLMHHHARASERRLMSRASGIHLASTYRYWRKFGLPLWGHGPRL